MNRKERSCYIGNMYYILRELKQVVDTELGYYPDDDVKALERIFQETRNNILLLESKNSTIGKKE